MMEVDIQQLQQSQYLQHPSATGVSATAVAITTTRAGVKSIERIVLTNAGSGYTSPPTITIIGGNGTGAIATCSIETTQKGVISYTVTNQGAGYSAIPTITVAGPTGSGTTSTAEAVINADKQVTSIRVTNLWHRIYSSSSSPSLPLQQSE